MKTHQDRIRSTRETALEADLEATVSALFRRYPTLCGFSVQDAVTLLKDREAGQLESDLILADIGVDPWTSHAQSGQILGEIAVALIEFMDECPEARELLRGRTFARTLH